MSGAFEGAQVALLMMLLGGLLAFGVLVNFFVCWLLSRAVASIPFERLRMEPGVVWLLLIPRFSPIWNSFVFPKLPQSFRSAFEARGETAHGDFGESLTWWTAGTFAASILPCLGFLAYFAYHARLILFLLQANDLREQMDRLTGTLD